MLTKKSHSKHTCTHRGKKEKRRTQGTVYLKGVNCTGRFKPSVLHIKQPRHTNTNGSLMEEKKILGRDSKESHSRYSTNLLAALQREVGQSTVGGGRGGGGKNRKYQRRDRRHGEKTS